MAKTNEQTCTNQENENVVVEKGTVDMSKTNKQMYTEQENENMVAEVSSGMNDPLEPENTPGTPENLVKQMEAVAQELKGTNEQTEEVINEGQTLGELIGNILSKYPKAVEQFNRKETWEERFNYARQVIEDLWIQGKHIVETTFLVTEKFVELDELQQAGNKEKLTFVQTVKKLAVQVISAVAGLVVETVFFTLDTALETVACLTRIAGHVVVEVVHSGNQIHKSFKKHYLK
ncbi:MAG: hypothetical protein IIZ99_04960 [Turicibacter sp.]|nr:hypothetical protein [Turicibacter sp.]